MKNKTPLFAFLILYAIALFRYESATLLSFGIDWRETYYPAANLLLHGQNPYLITTLHNPIWVLFPLVPFALAGERLGMIAMFFAAFFAYVYVAFKLRASPLALMFYMLSPLIVYNLMLGNVDWLVALGFIMPPSIGLFFVLLKPQIGIAVALYWLWMAYKNGGIVNAIKTFLPVTLCLALSFLLFGNWLAGKSDNILSASWNLSLFPYSIPIGLAIFYTARKKYVRAISASPFFSPYLSLGSWSIAQLGMVDNNLLTFFITTGLWMFFIVLSHTG